jgi:hypothetical protein
MRMGKIGDGIAAILGTVMALLSVPLFFLNMFGGVVSGIWLMILGRWSEFGLGMLILFAGALLIGLVLTPGMLVQAGGAVLLNRNRFVSGILLVGLGSLWTYFVMYLWCGITFVTMVRNADGHTVPLALWGYANAVAPWAYMASKDRESTGSALAVFAAQLGCAAMMVAVLFLSTPPTAAGLSPFLFPFIALGALAQIVLAIALGFAAHSDAKAQRRMGFA